MRALGEENLSFWRLWVILIYGVTTHRILLCSITFVYTLGANIESGLIPGDGTKYLVETQDS